MFSVHNAVEGRRPKPDFDTSFPIVSAFKRTSSSVRFVCYQMAASSNHVEEIENAAGHSGSVAMQEVVGDVTAQAAAQPPYKEGDVPATAQCFRCTKKGFQGWYHLVVHLRQSCPNKVSKKSLTGTWLHTQALKESNAASRALYATKKTTLKSEAGSQKKEGFKAEMPSLELGDLGSQPTGQQGVQWKVPPCLVLCDVANPLSLWSLVWLTKHVTENSRQELMRFKATCWRDVVGEARVPAWWWHGQWEDVVGDWTSSWWSVRWQQETNSHQYSKKRRTDIEGAFPTEVVISITPEALTWQGHPKDEAIGGHKKAGRRRTATPTKAMASTAGVDLGKFQH